jgi:geranylgeranyl transferase type-2 subunit beta
MDTHDSYLISLNQRLAAAVAEWPPSTRDAFARATLAAYVDGEGFRGRAGGADVYYTAFALRTLAVLGRDIEPIRSDLLAATGRLPTRSLPDHVSVLLIKSMLGADVDAAAPDALEQLRCDDGGYAKVPGGTSSTYATFLVGLAYDLLGRMPPEMDRVGEFILTRRRGDGGFAELAQMPAGSLNPTAAAAAVAMAAGVMDESVIEGVCRFLLESQRDDGSWPASGRVAAGDLLSTFTALLTLADLGAADMARPAAAERFVRACRIRPDGFGGSPTDNDTDVEYTFYGIGAMAVLGVQPQSDKPRGSDLKS